MSTGVRVRLKGNPRGTTPEDVSRALYDIGWSFENVTWDDEDFSFIAIARPGIGGKSFDLLGESFCGFRPDTLLSCSDPSLHYGGLFGFVLVVRVQHLCELVIVG